jgi:hypothetical protein
MGKLQSFTTNQNSDLVSGRVNDANPRRCNFFIAPS